MNEIYARNLARILTLEYGLTLKGEVRQHQDGPSCYLNPEGVDLSEGFEIRVTPGWHSIYCEFTPGRFARNLIQQMGSVNPENKKIFEAIVSSALRERGTFHFSLNGNRESPDKPDSWPDNWNSVEFSIRSPFIDWDQNSLNTGEVQEPVIHWAGLLLSMLIALLPVEEVEHEIREPEEVYRIEGAITRVEVTRYERSRVNRAACIAIHGFKCKICDFDFKQTYGEVGEGFIHVHHLIPVSRIGEDYRVNPETDLIPVCPNCHSIIHRKDPPFTPDQVLKFIENTSIR